jgi:hypothetical protein
VTLAPAIVSIVGEPRTSCVVLVSPSTRQKSCELRA